MLAAFRHSLDESSLRIQREINETSQRTYGHRSLIFASRRTNLKQQSGARMLTQGIARSNRHSGRNLKAQPNMKIRRTHIAIERQRMTLISTRKLSAVGWCS